MEGHVACNAMIYLKSHLYDCGLKIKQFIVILFIHSQVIDYFVTGL